MRNHLDIAIAHKINIRQKLRIIPNYTDRIFQTPQHQHQLLPLSLWQNLQAPMQLLQQPQLLLIKLPIQDLQILPLRGILNLLRQRRHQRHPILPKVTFHKGNGKPIRQIQQRQQPLHRLIIRRF